MIAAIWGRTTHPRPDWLEMMPQLPLVRGLPVVMGAGRFLGARAVVCRSNEDDHDVLVLWDDLQPIDEEHVGALRVDLSDPQGQRYAACVYLAALSQHEATTARRGCAWLRAALLGQGSDDDLYRLAVALEAVTP